MRWCESLTRQRLSFLNAQAQRSTGQIYYIFEEATTVEKSSMTKYNRSAFNAAISATCAAAAFITKYEIKSKNNTSCSSTVGSRLGCKTIPRVRRTVKNVLRLMGDTLFRRAYRMLYLRLKLLFETIENDLRNVIQVNPNRHHAPNGKVPLKSRLAMAIRFFAGGDAYDIAVIYGVGYTEVFNSVDYIEDSVNQCPSLKMLYPENHEDQKKIVLGFKAKSDVDFDNCAGCVDGILIWTHQPTVNDEVAGVSPMKYYCGRKHKYGLNMQAVCDYRCKILEISIKFGGSASDLIAWETSSLCHKLDRDGFLADGLCIYGDNAYVNKPSMATPYPNNSNYDLDKDNYNFFHSQLRINIECTFGLLYQRFGILRKKIPQQYNVTKTMALVGCLCRIHNYLIEASDTGNEVPSPLAGDDLDLTIDGAVPMMVEGTNGMSTPQELIGAGDHNDDDPNDVFRDSVSSRYASEELPRENMLQHVVEKGLRRPARSQTNRL